LSNQESAKVRRLAVVDNEGRAAGALSDAGDCPAGIVCDDLGRLIAGLPFQRLEQERETPIAAGCRKGRVLGKLAQDRL